MEVTALLQQLSEHLSQRLQKEGRIGPLQPTAGGSINETYTFVYAEMQFFLKLNEREAYPAMLAKELRALEHLRQQSVVKCPEPLLCFDLEQQQVLVMEHLQEKEWTTLAWEQLGEGLAHLHRNSNDRFGWEEDNYIGALVQHNSWQASWTEFFATARIEPLLRQCIDTGKLERRSIAAFEHLFQRLPDIFPPEVPALLHGDLWKGNVLSTPAGPAMIDPAIYFGHREMDLAMSHLFGGFHPAFYEAYEQTFSLEKGHAQRRDLCNLYPLLVHIILFGGSYRTEVQNILKPFL